MVITNKTNVVVRDAMTGTQVIWQHELAHIEGSSSSDNDNNNNGLPSQVNGQFILAPSSDIWLMMGTIDQPTLVCFVASSSPSSSSSSIDDRYQFNKIISFNMPNNDLTFQNMEEIKMHFIHHSNVTYLAVYASDSDRTLLPQLYLYDITSTSSSSSSSTSSSSSPSTQPRLVWQREYGRSTHVYGNSCVHRAKGQIDLWIPNDGRPIRNITNSVYIYLQCGNVTWSLNQNGDVIWYHSFDKELTALAADTITIQAISYSTNDLFVLLSGSNANHENRILRLSSEAEEEESQPKYIDIEANSYPVHNNNKNYEKEIQSLTIVPHSIQACASTNIDILSNLCRDQLYVHLYEADVEPKVNQYDYAFMIGFDVSNSSYINANEMNNLTPDIEHVGKIIFGTSGKFRPPG